MRTTLLALALVAAGPPCFAATPDPEALVQQGITYRRDRHDAEALDLFRRAYAASPTARVRAQIAFAEQALGRWVEAEGDLEAALGSSEDWIESRRGAFERELETIRAHLGRIDVETNAPDAVLGIGVTELRLPLRAPYRVDAGPLDIVVRAPGYMTERRRLDIAPDAHVHFVVALRPIATEQALLPPEREHAAPSGAKRGVWPWVTVGASALFVGAGVAAHVTARHAADDYNDDSKCYFGGVPRAVRCANERDTISESEKLMAIGYGGGAVLFGISLVLFMLPRAAAPAVAMCSPTPRGVGCSGRF